MTGNRTEVGKGADRETAQGYKGYKTAKPCRAADIHAQVWHPVDFGQRFTPFADFFPERIQWGQ